MKLPRRLSEGFVVSPLAHIGILGALFFGFASLPPKFDDAQETVPVEMVTDSQFNQVMKGDKSAKEVHPEATAKAEVAAPETPPTPTPPTPEQKDTPAPPPPPPPPPARTEAQPTPPMPPEPPPPPPPVPTPPERPQPPQPVAKTPPPVPTPPIRDVEAEPLEPKPIPKPVPKPPPPKPVPTPPKPPEVVKHEIKPAPPKPRVPEKPRLDQLAKLIQDEPSDAKPTPKPSHTKVKATHQTEEDSPSKFDPSDISSFLDHEAPARRASAASRPSSAGSAGSPTANAAKMAPNMWGQLDGLMEEQYRQCWSYLGLASGQRYVPQVRVLYSQDGSLAGNPELVNPPSDPALRSLADSALRAVRRCNPLHIPEQFAPYYNEWRARVLRFDPQEMAG